MKKFVFGMFLVLILGGAGAFWYVSNIDWNKHKDKIAEQFYNSTGKYVVFAGNVNFKVFPTPYLNASNVKIYNTKSREKDEKPLLDIKDVNAELSLVELLKGEINVSKMILDKALINIDWDDKGLNWQSDLSMDQRREMENAKMVLNSVSLKNTQVNFEASNAFMKEFSSKVAPVSSGENPLGAGIKPIPVFLAISFTSNTLCSFPVPKTIIIILSFKVF